MSVPMISLIALLVAILVSVVFSSLNIGALAPFLRDALRNAGGGRTAGPRGTAAPPDAGDNVPAP